MDLSHASDCQLSSLIRQGSVKAFEAIYNRYVGRIYSFCLPVVKSKQLTEEIVQDVFISLWKYRDNLDSDKSLSALLFTIARRYRINALRTIINSPIYEDYVELHNELPTYDYKNLDFSDLIRLLKIEVRKLPKTQQKIFILSRFENLPNDEIAQRLNIAEKTVQNQLSLALGTLRITLKKILQH